jgi:hypothetical protein
MFSHIDSRPIGIWIDHRQAVIAELASDGARVSIVESKVQTHPQRGGDSPLHGCYEAQQVRADDSRQRALTGELNHYYDRIMALLPHQHGLYLFGPGEAKSELQRRLVTRNPHVAAATVETTDKLTNKQIVATVRKHFGKYGWPLATRGSTIHPQPNGRES